jgi:hypothetical protein
MTTTQWFTRDGQIFTGHVFDVKANSASYNYLKRCYRCSGQGQSSAWARTGLVCYQCGGHGHLGTKVGKVYTAEKLAQLVAAQEKRDQESALKREAEAEKFRQARRKLQEEFNASHPGLIESMRSSNDSFLQNLVEAFDLNGTLTEKQAEAAKAKVERLSSALVGVHVGTVGERLDLTVTVTYAKASEGRFGYTTFITFVDANENRFVWKASGRFNYEPGQTVKGVATVKDHVEFKGHKQTALTRAKFTVISQEVSSEA